jgi:hypothetical protein
MRGVPDKLPIKTELFSFITYRGPEHLKQEEKNIRFVIDDNFLESKTATLLTNNSASKKSAQSFDDKIATLSNTITYQELRSTNPNFYDFANKVFKNKSTVQEVYNQSVEAVTPLTQGEVAQLFQELYYQIFTQQSSYVRQGITQMLIVNHVINNVTALVEKGITKLTDIKIEIPAAILEKLRSYKFAECGATMDGVQNLGIADFRRVEQEVCCYVPGEVSHIENVMAKEYKERATRNFMRTENTVETSRETEVENLTDTTTSSRNEINTEVASVLQQDRSTSFGGSVGVSGKIGNAKIDVNAFGNFATNNSSTHSNNEAKTYAEEVTKRALERILQKTSEKRTSKIIKEFEENNKHGFDNRNGDKHVTGIYRWVDIIYKNRLVNYGKRLMVEFMVPEPATFYKTILKYVPKDGTPNPNQPKVKPKSLPDFAINSKENITRENYTSLATYYNVTLDTPLEEDKVISKSILPPMPRPSDNNSKSYSETMAIEPFYEANVTVTNVDMNYTRSSGSSAYFKVDVGSLSFLIDGLPNGRKRDVSRSFNGIFTTKYTNSIDVNFDYRKINSCTTYVEIRCKLTVAKFDEWQESCYQKLETAYKSLLADYNDWLAQQTKDNAAGNKEAKKTNPAMNRLIEERELKRICIEMIMKPFCRAQGQKNYTDQNACDLYKIPQVNQTPDFANYAAQVKFFEQAIDWQIMSYLFYAYYWADKCDWASLMQTESDDMIFQAFLQSSMARVVVPIRQQFTEAFAYYLQSGEIWLGNELVPGEGNDLYLSIAEEMQTVAGVVEDEWETRVPTTLAIIQGKSAYLEEEGLPCCNDIKKDKTTNIFGSEITLQIIKPK